MLESQRQADHLVIIGKIRNEIRNDINVKHHTSGGDIRGFVLRLVDHLFDVIDDYERGLRDEAFDKIDNYEQLVWKEKP